MGRFRGIELDGVELAGARLTLRRWRADDADAVVEVMRDRAMYEWLALPDPYTPEVAREFVTSLGHEGRSTGTGLGCAVVETASGSVVGSAALRLAVGGELAYWIRTSARGRGYAAEAVRLLRDWAFGAAQLRRVWLQCDVRNLASVRVAMAAGLRFEGVQRGPVPGPDEPANTPTDLARFGLLVTDPADSVPPAFAALPAGGLTDGMITLRAMRPDDAGAYRETHDEVSVGWGFDGLAMSDDEAQRRASTAGLDWLVGRQAEFTIVDHGTGSFAGEVTLRLAGPPQVGGIGYSVHPAFRGRGYTARALRLLVPWAFGPAGFARLELGAKVGNVASQRAAASAGFEPDGVRAGRLRNADGTFADEVRFMLVNQNLRRV